MILRTIAKEDRNFKHLLRKLVRYYYDVPFRCVVLYREMRKTKFKLKKYRLCKKLIIKYGVTISFGASIGDNFRIAHNSNIVIGERVVIGNNCTIYQGVTIGQNYGGYPTIGNNVIIYAGAKIFGDITIGNNVIIGANAVVNTDIPDNAVIGGVPAKIIKMNNQLD